jgi:hypothetical protein
MKKVPGTFEAICDSQDRLYLLGSAQTVEIDLSEASRSKGVQQSMKTLPTPLNFYVHENCLFTLEDSGSHIVVKRNWTQTARIKKITQSSIKEAYLSCSTLFDFESGSRIPIFIVGYQTSELAVEGERAARDVYRIQVQGQDQESGRTKEYLFEWQFEANVKTVDFYFEQLFTDQFGALLLKGKIIENEATVYNICMSQVKSGSRTPDDIFHDCFLKLFDGEGQSWSKTEEQAIGHIFGEKLLATAQGPDRLHACLGPFCKKLFDDGKSNLIEEVVRSNRSKA